MTLPQALTIAEKHSNNAGVWEISAKKSIYQARKLYEMGRYEYVWGWIIRSLQFSIGVYHDDYQNVIDSYENRQS